MEVPDIPRVEAPNPFNYSEQQLADKKAALKRAVELYPNVPLFYAELAYDLCMNTPEDELQTVMNRCDEPPRKRD